MTIIDQIPCLACGKLTSTTTRWAAVLSKGEVVGHTCPACPRRGTGGEPIRRVVNRSGTARFRVTLDIGADPRGKRRQESKYFSTLAEARSYVRTRGSEIKTSRTIGKAVAGRDLTTLDILCERWLEARRGEIREVTRETYGHALKPVRRRLGSRRVQALTYAEILGLRTWMSREGSASGGSLGDHAVKASLAALKQVLDFGIRSEGILSENVARSVKAPRTDEIAEVGVERWTAQELLKFTECADRDALAAAWRLATLGLRREEVLGLTWDAVDFAAGTISIRQSRVSVSKATDPRRWMIGKPKSAASKRVIKPDLVQPGTMSALRELRLACVNAPATNPQGLVVVDAAGDPLLPATFSSRFAALTREGAVPLIKLHSTRHTVAYLLHDAGVPPVRAAAFLGHTLAVHLGTYLFAREDDVDLAAGALGESLLRTASGS